MIFFQLALAAHFQIADSNMTSLCIRDKKKLPVNGKTDFDCLFQLFIYD